MDNKQPNKPIPAVTISSRNMALMVVLFVLMFMLAPSIKMSFDKSREVAALEEVITTQKTEKAALEKQLSRWQDPHYVRQQARERINMVMPGETAYWVTGTDVHSESEEDWTANKESESTDELDWTSQLLESMK